jgi:hypothetical protein
MPLYKSVHPLVVAGCEESLYPAVILSSAVVPPKFDRPVPDIKNGNAMHNKKVSLISLMIVLPRPGRQKK